ncbi:hypothetical protein C1Y27_31085 [Pseudomonas sp. GW704-F2]|nr:hypothetical protein C1Y27_31085 [Pseudomonas sp. GW704-F2]
MRIGLVGYGHGGRFFHAPLTVTLPSTANTRSMWEGASPLPQLDWVCTSIKELMYANWTSRLWPRRALLSCATDCNPAFYG